MRGKAHLKIGVVLPTRGLVFTRVEDAIEKNREKYEIQVYRSHDLPIPFGHCLLSEKALNDGCTHLWFIEEDTVPPDNALDLLIEADTDIACIDYGVAGWGCITRNSKGEVLWCGLGCTLIKREVFEALKEPYFRVDKVLRLNDWTWQELPDYYLQHKNYGTLDIWFCTQARKAGFKIKQVDGECDHLLLEQLGQREVNNGLHTISLKPKIKNKQILKGGD